MIYFTSLWLIWANLCLKRERSAKLMSAVQIFASKGIRSAKLMSAVQIFASKGIRSAKLMSAVQIFASKGRGPRN